MNFKNQSRRRAFTLVEIMIAIAIFSIVVAAIYSTWVLILKSSKTSGWRPPHKSSASASPCGRLKTR